MIVWRIIFVSLIPLTFSLAGVVPLFAQEKIGDEGVYSGFIISGGRQSVKVGPIKPGQTLQAFLSPEWTTEKGGRMECRLEDPDGPLLKSGSQSYPAQETVLLEWTSNSKPKPAGYWIHVQGGSGGFSGEILGQYKLRIFLWDQNDGNSGTDAPEVFEKALQLPVSEPGLYSFEECFISATADNYDIYKIVLEPNHSFSWSGQPLGWKGSKGKVYWEVVNKSFKRLKAWNTPLDLTSSTGIKVFHPQVKADTKPTIFYLLVKAEGEVSLIYGLQVEIKEGR